MELGGFFCTLTGALLSTSSAHASPVPCCVGHGGRWEHLHHGNCQVLTDEGLSQASWLLNIPHCVTDCLLYVKHERVPGAQHPLHTQWRPCRRSLRAMRRAKNPGLGIFHCNLWVSSWTSGPRRAWPKGRMTLFLTKNRILCCWPHATASVQKQQ